MRACLLVLAFLSQSCFSARYVAQAARGQLAIAGEARPLAEAVRDPETPEPARRLLAAVPAVKAWAQRQGLTPTRSYERYADLGRPAAVWVVQACPPLALEPKRWSFPVVGTVPYLGFFDEGAARRYARELEQGGLDVDVRTASAFSTLGWFRDPVLSTMLGRGDAALGELADVVLHESVHATVYVKDQSAFDESLASFVADRLTPDLVAALRGRDAPEVAAWVAAHRRERERLARLHAAYEELDAVYRSPAPEPEKLAAKARVLGRVEAELGARRPLNNAALAGHRAYDASAGGFERLFQACGESFPRLLAAARTLGPRDFDRPQQPDLAPVLDALAVRCRRPEAVATVRRGR
jgi:predicted aminopeptidase